MEKHIDDQIDKTLELVNRMEKMLVANDEFEKRVLAQLDEIKKHLINCS
jgi:hypothetical protein